MFVAPVKLLLVIPVNPCKPVLPCTSVVCVCAHVFPWVFVAPVKLVLVTPVRPCIPVLPITPEVCVPVCTPVCTPECTPVWTPVLPYVFVDAVTFLLLTLAKP